MFVILGGMKEEEEASVCRIEGTGEETCILFWKREKRRGLGRSLWLGCSLTPIANDREKELPYLDFGSFEQPGASFRFIPQILREIVLESTL